MSRLLIDPGFTTDAMSEAFSDEAKLKAILTFEAALATAQGELEMIPVEHAREIARACDADVEDPGAMLMLGWEFGTPLIPVVRWLTEKVPATAASSVHYRATTQDAVDTATVMLMKAALTAVTSDLVRVGNSLASFAGTHRLTPVLGRTFLQPATTTSFGARVASWLSPLGGLIGDLRWDIHTFPIQLGGPVGDMSGFGESGPALVDRVASILDLKVPISPWHTDRTPIRRVMEHLNAVGIAMAKVAYDLTLLSQIEIGEVQVRSGGSSSMPGKRNPIDAIRCLAAAQVCATTTSLVTTAARHELERGAGSWHTETFAIPVVFNATHVAIGAMISCLESMTVDSTRMLANIESYGADQPPSSVGALVDGVVAEWNARAGEQHQA
ncbi:MAG TPA: lyase family protein [Acidimicrobiia bacterium]